MSISFIMKMGDLDSENRKVLSGPLSTLQLSSQFVRELFTVYIICIVEKYTILLLLEIVKDYRPPCELVPNNFWGVAVNRL